MRQGKGNAKARKLAKRLKSDTRPWREIALDYPPVVKPGTLNRIAKSGGAWMPKKDIILIALGMKKQPKPEWLNVAVRFLREKAGLEAQ